MDYLVYAYLQLGQDDKAKAVVNEMSTVTGFSETFIPGPYAAAASPARYVLERGDWKVAENLTVRPTPLANAQAITYFAEASPPFGCVFSCADRRPRKRKRNRTEYHGIPQ